MNDSTVVATKDVISDTITPMKSFLLFALSLLCLHADAADFHKFLYSIEAYNCAASFADGATTRYGIQNIPGATEQTAYGLVGQTKANFHWGTFFAEKGALCGIPVVVSWAAHRAATSDGKKLDLFILGPTAIVAGWQTWGSVNNIKYIRAYRVNGGK